MSDITAADIEAMNGHLGHLYIEPRVDLNLPDQVRLLLALATAERPGFRRTIPVKRTDHDILICHVLRKFVVALDESRAERDAANARADQAIRFAAQVEEECARLTEALRLCERALRDQPMQAFRSDDARRRRSTAIDAARAALAPITHDLPSDGRES